MSTDEQHIDVPVTEETEATTEESATSTDAELATATEDRRADRPTTATTTADDDDSDDDGSDDDDDSADDDDDDDGDQPERASTRGARRTAGSGDLAARLEREGEIAADFLERLLDIADLDGDLDVDVEGERASVAIVDSSEGRVPRRLVGQNGEVLDALQELTRLAVQARTGDRTRLMLDVAGHRARRREQLVVRAKEAIGEVQQSGEPLRLEAMNPFERKIVHDAVSAAGLQSSSEGVEPERRIVIRPAD